MKVVKKWRNERVEIYEIQKEIGRRVIEEGEQLREANSRKKYEEVANRVLACGNKPIPKQDPTIKKRAEGGRYIARMQGCLIFRNTNKG